MTWCARQYLAFEDERTRPSRDLLNAVRGGITSAVDVGCGPGNSTAVIAARFPAAALRGFDNSPDMIAAARRRLPDVRFDVLELTDWLREAPQAVGVAAGVATGVATGVGLIFANAVLQWVPDHAAVLPALVARLAPSGCLAVQMPDNLDEPAHRLMRDVARKGPWTARLQRAAAARAPLGTSQEYYDLLKSTGCQVDVWRTTYHHALPGGPQAIVEWFKGSGLRPFLDALEGAEREAYLAEYRSALTGAYPPTADGGVLLPFPRLFFVACRD